MQVPSKALKGASAAEGGARQGVAASTGAMAQSGVAVADPRSTSSITAPS